MPGKRRNKKNSSRTDSPESEKTVPLYQIIRLQDFDLELKNKLALIDSILKKRINAIEWAFSVALKKIPPEILHSKIQWSNSQDVLYSGRNINEFICEQSTTKLPWPRSSSSSSLSTRTASRNVSQTSSLDTGIGMESSIMRGKYKTPGCKTGFSSVPDLITPKVSGKGPLCMARYPQEGEMAISLSGSPLMVTPLIQHYRANTNIMLSDGKVMSILPEQGLRPNDIPILDEETRNELLTLKENISAFINMTRGKLQSNDLN